MQKVHIKQVQPVNKQQPQQTYRTFLPMLPSEQNAKLFGEQGPTPPESYEGLFELMAGQIGEMANMKVGKNPVQPTVSWLPDIGELRSPRKALDELSGKRWAFALEAFELFANNMLPVPPSSVLRLPGWTRYGSGEPTQVEYPTENVFFYDTETYVLGGNHPLIGVALSEEAWYVWLHPQLLSPMEGNIEPLLIPVGPNKVVIAHNAMFDLSKTLEAYNLTNDGRPAAMCTMAMHTTRSGLGGDQVLRAFKAAPNAAWARQACPDSLAAVVKFYTGITMDKEARDLFVKGTLTQIRANLEGLLTYALKDVQVLHDLWLALWPAYQEQCPATFTTTGLLELSRSLLTVTADYDRRWAANKALHGIEIRKVQRLIDARVEEILELWASGELDPAENPWLKQLDWTPAKSGKNKGKPAWLRKLKGLKVTLGCSAAPLVLQMTWKGFPLAYSKTSKWGYLSRETGATRFVKLPHESGKNANVGSPFSKQFTAFAESGVLSSDLDISLNIPKELAKLTYWEAYESRFKEEYKMPVADPTRLGVVPVTKLVGTLTGRQVHKTWLTAAQCKIGKNGETKKLGSDFFHTLQPPQGMDYVSWDEDTEEVRIAGFWADLNQGLGLGCTPMSQTALLGKKSDKTDAHSVTALLTGIDRDSAKTANFRDIFGGGRSTQTKALQAAHPDWPEHEVAEKVSKIMLAKRGTKSQGLYSGGTDSMYHNQAAEIANTPDFRLPGSGRMIPNVVNCRYDFSGNFYTSRYNFPVQGTGADILHATAASVPLLCEMKGIPESAYGYVLARHDEIGYNVLKEYSEKFAEVANAAHTWAWAVVLHGMGFNWLPTAITRLSAINIDCCVRKEVKAPTNAGYGCGWDLPNGREVN